MIFGTYSQRQNICQKVQKSSKIGQENFDTCFCVSFDSYYQNLLCERETGHYSVFPQIFVYSFPYFVNSLGNSYTNLITLSIKYRFTCGELKLRGNTVNC